MQIVLLEENLDAASKIRCLLVSQLLRSYGKLAFYYARVHYDS